MRSVYLSRITIPDFAVITTFKPPIATKSLDDVADFKIVYRTPEGFENVYYQVDMLIEPIHDLEVLARARRRLRNHLDVFSRHPDFVKHHGECQSVMEMVGNKTQEHRLKGDLNRILTYYKLGSYIKAIPDSPGSCVTDIRLHRGLHLKVVPAKLQHLLEGHDNQVVGTMNLFNERHMFMLWHPRTLNMSNMAKNLLRQEVEKEIKTSFPFIDMSRFEMNTFKLVEMKDTVEKVFDCVPL